MRARGPPGSAAAPRRLRDRLGRRRVPAAGGGPHACGGEAGQRSRSLVEVGAVEAAERGVEGGARPGMKFPETASTVLPMNAATYYDCYFNRPAFRALMCKVRLPPRPPLRAPSDPKVPFRANSRLSFADAGQEHAT